MIIKEGTTLTATDLANLGFKECPTIETAKRILRKQSFSSVVLTDYNGSRQIFYLDNNETARYARPFNPILDMIMFSAD